MFHYDRGLKITSIDLAVDMRRRMPRAFVSHAHTDHMAKHEMAYCTPATGRLYRKRFGERPVSELPCRQPYDFAGVRLTTYPAGHVLGSAMLLADDGKTRLLYTGDFKLGESATAEAAELPRADVLVMECTFGEPEYCLPPRAEVVANLIDLVRTAIRSGQSPVVHAYTLGKSQEVTKLLTQAGIPVLQHAAVFEISQVYEAAGCDLGDYRLYPGHPVPGTAIVAPPKHQKVEPLPRLENRVSIAVSGWALDATYARRQGVDHALPLSDHADYNDLLAAIELVQPRVIYCTHGPADYYKRLRKLGYNAFPLDDQAGRASPPAQRLLF